MTDTPKVLEVKFKVYADPPHGINIVWDGNLVPRKPGEYHLIEFSAYQSALELKALADQEWGIECARVARQRDEALSELHVEKTMNAEMAGYKQERDSLSDQLAWSLKNEEQYKKAFAETNERAERAEENHHFYQREWESACERYNYAKEELTALRERAAGLVSLLGRVLNGKVMKQELEGALTMFTRGPNEQRFL
jgi:hypothetical protein